MGLVSLDRDNWKKQLSRVLIVGGPNTFKTTSIVETFPKPIHIISYPGEQGSAVIPIDDPEVHGYVWQEDDPSKISLSKQIADLEKFTFEVLTGGQGPIATFAGDGLHKLASMYWNREYQRLLAVNEDKLASGVITENDLQIRAYGNENYGATREILFYLSRIRYSNVPTVVFTCWEGPEPDGGDRGSKSSHIFADLPGKLARRTVGEFGVVLYAETSLPDPKGKQTGTWQIRKAGKVWGVGAKIPKHIATKLPEKVPQDWSKLYPFLLGEVEKIEGAIGAVPQVPAPASAQKPTVPSK